MSPREKNLITLFAVAGFLILNVVAFRYYNAKKADVLRDRLDAEQKLTVAQTFSASREQVLDQMDWLTQHEPQPAAYQDVQSKLQQLVESEAQNTGLTIRPNSQKLLPTDQTPGHHYHRAKVQITVTGTEEALYRWFDKMNIPEQFRAATSIRLAPDREDDTKIDCTTVIEQWFVPPPST
jgi:hypothetical protein